MRKNIVIVGIIILVIGFMMFFGGPYIFKSTVNLNQLVPLKNSFSLNPGSGIDFTVVPAGKVMAAVYNDSLSKPIEFNTINKTVNTQNENGTFIIEYYNAGNSNQTIKAVNNYTVPMTVNYSVLIFSASGIIYSIIAVLLGGALMFIGGTIAVVGLILKSKRPNPV
jgi:hypothetical protein